LVHNLLSEKYIKKGGPVLLISVGEQLCLLFNIALEKVIRDAAVNTRGTIFYKSVQILAYADDIDIIGRTQL
jgi:hypothetical protein